jgi:hypothetical protein
MSYQAASKARWCQDGSPVIPKIHVKDRLVFAGVDSDLLASCGRIESSEL